MIERNQPASSQHRFRRQWMALCGASALALGTTFATSAWDDPKPGAPVGLRGILPADVPATLNEDVFANLEGNWKEWATQAAAEINKLYTDASLDLNGQRLQLEVLKIKLKTMESSLKNSQYSGIHATLANLHAPLSRRVSIAEAVLDTLAIDPKQAVSSRLDSARQAVSIAVKNLESELKVTKNGPAWLTYVRSAEVGKVINDKNTSPEAVNLLIAVVQKLTPTDTTSPEVRNFLTGDRQTALRDALASYGQALAASEKPTNPDQLRAALATLVAAIEKHEESQATGDAVALRQAFDAVRKAAPDGGNRIASAMASNYFNYNLRVVLSEGFLTRLVAQDKSQSGDVSDCILGARVSGCQFTDTHATIDLKPSNNGITFQIKVRGTTRSNTLGVTDEAQVHTIGNHQFWATKSVNYDGTRFSTGPANISVNPNNTTVGVTTQYSGIPLLGGIIDSYAQGVVEEKRPEAQAIAAQRISERVVPEMNKEVDDKFSEMNRDLETGVEKRLKEQNLWPSAKSYRSTDDEMRANLRLMSEQEIGGSDSPNLQIPSNGFVVALHESMLNNAMARLKIAGKTMTDDELGDEIERSFSDVLGRKFNASKKIEESAQSKKEPATFIFPDRDPIQFRMDNGQLILIIRAGLKQTGEEDIPTQVISVPLTFKVDGTKLVIESGEVGVSPVETPKNTALQITRSGIVRTKVKNALPTRNFDRFITIDKNVPKPINIGVSSITPTGGWMVISFQ